MKLGRILATLIFLSSVGCKIENSSATANNKANANVTQSPSANDSAPEAKSNCSLTTAVSPLLKGLKLGATSDEVLALFPGSRDDSEVQSNLARAAGPQGESALIIRPAKFGSKDKFEGISHINFNFLDGRVSSLNLGYHGPQYANVDEFVAKFVKGTNFPPADQWQGYPGMDTQMKTLTCKDFEVRVFIGGEGGNQNYVLLTDLEASKTLKDRRKKARAQATPTPTP